MVVFSEGDGGAADYECQHMLHCDEEGAHLHHISGQQRTGKFVKLGHLEEVKVVWCSCE